jgi:hypothetical protein
MDIFITRRSLQILIASQWKLTGSATNGRGISGIGRNLNYLSVLLFFIQNSTC